MTTQANKNVKNGNKATKVVTTEVIGADLEVVQSTEQVNNDEAILAATPKYGDRAFLEANYPTDADFEGNSTPHYKPEREVKIKAGLEMAEKLGIKINPLTLLLAKWWEVKPARAAIKKMIDEEAKEKQIPEVNYTQEVLRAEVESLASMLQACDRLKYSINYFKPRDTAKIGKDFTKEVKIEDTVYVISNRKLEEIVAKFTDRDERRAAIIEAGEVKKFITEEEF